MNTLSENKARYPAWIETGRLLLRPPRIEDALDLFALAAKDESFSRCTVGDEANSIESACTAIARMLEDRRLGIGAWWVALEKATGRIAGIAGYSERNASAGLVYALAADYAGKGYAYEAIEALSKSGSDRRSDALRRVGSDADSLEASEAHARWYWHSKAAAPRKCRMPRCA